jgi:AraC family transcriptional regulator
MSEEDHLDHENDRILTQVSPDIARFLTGSILRQPSSVELGWRNLAVERRTIVPSEYPELILERHFLLLWEGHVAEGEVASRGGRFSPYKKYPDTVTILQPGIRPPIRNRLSHEVIVAALEPQFMTGMEEELDRRPSGSLEDLQGIADPDLRNIVGLLLHESNAGGPYGTLYTDSLAAALATRLAFDSRRKQTAVKTASYMLPGRALRRVTDRMRVDLGTDLDLSTLAAESGYSRAHFLRTFKATTGQTPHRYLTELRLQKARDLLAGQSLSLIDIAAACGFSSHAHLTTVFHSRFGVTPSEYRRGGGKRHELAA